MIDIMQPGPRYSDRKVRGVKELIVNSPDCTELCKKALLWLIDQSDNLSQPVQVKTTNESIGWEIAKGVHALNSHCLETQLSERLRKRGIRSYFHSACCDEDENGSPYYRIWLAPQNVPDFHIIPEIPFDIDAINAIVLPT